MGRLVALLGHYWPPQLLVETALGGAAVGDAVVKRGCLPLGSRGPLARLGGLGVMGLEDFLAVVFFAGAFLVNIGHAQATLLVD